MGICFCSNSNAAAMTSTDGITWTNRTMTTNPSWSDVVYGVGSSGGRFVAIARAVIPTIIQLTE